MNNPNKNTGQQNENNNEYPGYPQYPAGEDIYAQSLKEEDTDPETGKPKDPVEDVTNLNEKSFANDKSGSDLDIPGAELDDTEESIGSEDEENNYYSLGGDNHENQEEYKGE